MAQIFHPSSNSLARVSIGLALLLVGCTLWAAYAINSGDFGEALDESFRSLALEYLSALDDRNARVPTNGSRSEHAVQHRSINFEVTSAKVCQTRWLTCACGRD